VRQCSSCCGSPAVQAAHLQYIVRQPQLPLPALPLPLRQQLDLDALTPPSYRVPLLVSLPSAADDGITASLVAAKDWVHGRWVDMPRTWGGARRSAHACVHIDKQWGVTGASSCNAHRLCSAVHVCSCRRSRCSGHMDMQQWMHCWVSHASRRLAHHTRRAYCT
jgi:hypothetical protein